MFALGPKVEISFQLYDHDNHIQHYTETHLPMFVPTKNILLSLTIGFLHENVISAYFVFLANLSSSLALIVGYFRTFGFLPRLGAFSVGQGGHTLQHSNILVAFKRPSIQREHSLAFFSELDRHTLRTMTLTNLGRGSL